MSAGVDQATQRRRGVGLIAHDAAQSFGGYTLIAPQTAGGRVFLVDIHGTVVHEWQLPVRPGRHAVILPNGNLGYNGSHADSPDLYAPWSMWHGGDFYEVTPAGEVVWRYQDPAHHHDAQWLLNGHLLYAACERVDEGFAQRVPGGTGDPATPLYADVVREVDRSGRLVWEWHAAEHLDPAHFPIHPGFGRYHWPLVNGLGTTADGLVLMSLRTTSGVIGVDRASGQVQLHIPPELVSHQHAPVALDNGHILVFDNGNFRTGSHVAFSRVLEIDPQDGKRIAWQYQDETAQLFYSPFMGNAQRLPNGNTHVTESSTGRLFEVTPAGQVVWEYVIPWFAEYPDAAARKTGPGQLNSVFQTFRYAAHQIPWL